MSVAIPSLSRRLQPTSTRCDSIRRTSSSNRIASLRSRARRTEPAPSITALAQPQLNVTPPTNEDPIAFRPHPAPTADFWTRSSRCDEGAALHRTGDPESPRVGALGLSLFRRTPFIASAGIRPKSAPVNGEPRPRPPHDLHRLSADRGARSQLPSQSYPLGSPRARA